LNNNDLFDSLPNSVELNLNDVNNNEIKISNSFVPIIIKISRIVNKKYSFVKVNCTKMNFTNGQQLMINSFVKSKSNSSINIHLKPNDLNLAYLIVLKFSDLLIYNSSQQSYDYFQIMCPQSGIIHYIIFNRIILKIIKLIDLINESYFSLFRNMNQTNNYKGIVTFGIRELNETELNNYCLINQTNISIPPMIDESLNFTSDFSLRYVLYILCSIPFTSKLFN